MRIWQQLGLTAILSAFAVSATAQVTIPAAASMQLGGGTLDLSGTDLQVGGTFGTGSGSVASARNISILAGGLFDAGSGAIGLSGNWSNLGNFVAGTSVVSFVDGGLAQTVIAGATTFYDASFVSTTGKNYVFPVGATQTFTNALTVLGTASTGIEFRSSTPGLAAFVDLLTGGTQNIDFVGVSNVHGTGQILAPTRTNDGGTGDDTGWFGAAIAVLAAVPAPTLTTLGMPCLKRAMIYPATRRYRVRLDRTVSF